MKSPRPLPLRHAFFLIIFLAAAVLSCDIYEDVTNQIIRNIMPTNTPLASTWEPLQPNTALDTQWANPENTPNPEGTSTPSLWDFERCNALDEIFFESHIMNQFENKDTSYCSYEIIAKNISTERTIIFLRQSHQITHNAFGDSNTYKWGGATLKPGESVSMAGGLAAIDYRLNYYDYIRAEHIVGIVQTPECQWIQEDDYLKIAAPLMGLCLWP